MIESLDVCLCLGVHDKHNDILATSCVCLFHVRPFVSHILISSDYFIHVASARYESTRCC